MSRSNANLADSKAMISIPLIMGELSLFLGSSSAIPNLLHLLLWLRSLLLLLLLVELSDGELSLNRPDELLFSLGFAVSLEVGG